MSHNIRVKATEAKGSSRTRATCASVMATQAPQSAFYQSTPEVKASCDGMIKAGADVAAAAEAVHAALAVLRNARKTRKSKIVAFDNAYNVCIAMVEHHATTPEDVTSLALTVLERQSHGLAPPLAIQARFIAAKGVVRVRVKLPPGATGCLLEVTTDPTNPASYRRLPGTGKLRTLSGYAPGTYWFRVASVRADEESEPISPVSVIVR